MSNGVLMQEVSFVQVIITRLTQRLFGAPFLRNLIRGEYRRDGGAGAGAGVGAMRRDWELAT